jgi:hypothetical protein
VVCEDPSLLVHNTNIHRSQSIKQAIQNPKSFIMKFSALTISPLVCLISASPVLDKRQQPLCSGLTGNQQCCAVDVLGVADLNCANRTLHVPTKSSSNMRRISPDRPDERSQLPGYLCRYWAAGSVLLYPNRM